MKKNRNLQDKGRVTSPFTMKGEKYELQNNEKRNRRYGKG